VSYDELLEHGAHDADGFVDLCSVTVNGGARRSAVAVTALVTSPSASSRW
jgi:hypothetical protein